MHFDGSTFASCKYMFKHTYDFVQLTDLKPIFSLKWLQCKLMTFDWIKHRGFNLHNSIHWILAVLFNCFCLNAHKYTPLWIITIETLRAEYSIEILAAVYRNK